MAAMTQYGVYANPAAPEGAPLISHGIAIVETTSAEDAVTQAIEMGIVRPGEVYVIDLTDAQRFLAEIDSTVTVKPEDVESHPEHPIVLPDEPPVDINPPEEGPPEVGPPEQVPG